MTDFEVKGYKNKCGWLYSDSVKEHFFSPKNLFKSIEEAKQYEKDADGIGEVGSPACLPPYELFCTPHEIAQMGDISVENKAIGFSGDFNQITELKKRNFQGDLMILKTKLGIVRLTQDHLVYSIRRPNERKYAYTKNRKNLAPEWNSAKNLTKNDFIIFPRFNKIKELKEIEISSIKKKYDFKSKELPKKIKLTLELLKLFGYFIAEGSTRKDEKRSNEVCFTFGIKEKEFVDEVVFLIRKYFHLQTNVKKRESNNRYDIIVHNVHLSRLFRKWFGGGSQNKKIPDFLMTLPPDTQKGLICGLWRGDGYINAKRAYPRAGYSSTSRLLINQLKYLLLRQEIIPSIYSEKGKTSKWANHKENFRIQVGDLDSLGKLVEIVENRNINCNSKQKNSWFDIDYFYTPITQVKKEKYSGPVHNLEVKKSHSFCTEAFCVHNCGDVMKMFIKVKDGKIIDCKWQTFGCASAIASTSMLSTMVIGKTLEEAKKITPKEIVKELGGLPPRKIHCSVLGDQALRAAIEDYESKQKNTNKEVKS